MLADQINEARASKKYTDDDIVSYLAKTKFGPQIEEARKNYDSTQILDFLSSRKDTTQGVATTPTVMHTTSPIGPEQLNMQGVTESPTPTIGEAAQGALAIVGSPLVPAAMALGAVKEKAVEALKKHGGPIINYPIKPSEIVAAPEAYPAGVAPEPAVPTNVGTFREHGVGEYPRPEATTSLAEMLPNIAEQAAWIVGPKAVSNVFGGVAAVREGLGAAVPAIEGSRGESLVPGYSNIFKMTPEEKTLANWSRVRTTGQDIRKAQELRTQGLTGEGRGPERAALWQNVEPKIESTRIDPFSKVYEARGAPLPTRERTGETTTASKWETTATRGEAAQRAAANAEVAQAASQQAASEEAWMVEADRKARQLVGSPEPQQPSELIQQKSVEGARAGEIPRVQATVQPRQSHVFETKRAKTSEAASQIKDTTMVNDRSMGQMIDLVEKGTPQQVLDELSSIYRERGRDTFIDWMHPSKIQGRLYKKLMDEGGTHSGSKAIAQAAGKNYQAAYDEVLRQGGVHPLQKQIAAMSNSDLEQFAAERMAKAGPEMTAEDTIIHDELHRRANEQIKKQLEILKTEEHATKTAEQKGIFESYIKEHGLNASGESPASAEAISRVKSEKAKGQGRFKIDMRNPKDMKPLVGVDAVDATVQPWEVIVQKGVGKNGGYTVLSQGTKVTGDRAKVLLQKLNAGEIAAAKPKRVLLRDVKRAEADYQSDMTRYGENNMATSRSQTRYYELRDAYAAQKAPRVAEPSTLERLQTAYQTVRARLNQGSQVPIADVLDEAGVGMRDAEPAIRQAMKEGKITGTDSSWTMGEATVAPRIKAATFELTAPKGTKISDIAFGGDIPAQRPFREIVRDINTALGTAGARPVGGAELTAEQQAALVRLREDLNAITQRAYFAGRTVEQYLTDIGTDPAVVRNLVGYSNAVVNTTEKIAASAERASEPGFTTPSGGGGNIVSKTDPLRSFLENMQREGRAVEKYEKGSKTTPQRQTPQISPGPVTTPDKDISRARTYLSPHNVMGRFGLKNNPVIDAFESHMAYKRNLENVRQWSRDLLRGVDDASERIRERIQPLFDQYKPILDEYGNLKSSAAELESKLEKANRRTKPVIQAELDSVHTDMKRLEEQMAPMRAERDRIFSELAKESPDVRIALYVDKKLPRGTVMLTPEELEIAGKVRQYLDMTGDQLKALGIRVIENRKYTTHVMNKLMGDEKFMGLFSNQRSVQTILNFQRRLPDSEMWFPSIRTIMESYVPMAEHKVAYQPFLNKWADAIARLNDTPQLQKYMQDWITANMWKKSASIAEKGLNALVDFEYMRLIGGSLSVGLKHIYKLANTWAEHGFATGLQALGKAAKIPGQAVAERLGSKGVHTELNLYRAFAAQKDLLRSLDEIPGMSNRVMNVMKRITGQPVMAVEAMDNAVSIMAGVLKAGKKGLDQQMAERAIWKTIFDCNFRAGWDQPLFQKSTGVRAVTMFQMTPFKLAEFKLNLVRQALKGEKDAFGTHYGTKLLRYLITMGVAEGVARANDTSVIDMWVHLPFISHIIAATKGGYRMGKLSAAQSPPLQLVAQMKEQGIPGGVAEHLKQWGVASKVFRVATDKRMPKSYESKAKYFLGLQKYEPLREPNKRK